MNPPRARVAAYVVRNGAAPGLLVFEHVGMPQAGLQVPAGGVRPGEAPADAVRREVEEETGLRGAVLVRELAVDERPHPVTGRPRRTAFFHLQAPSGTPDAWEHTAGGDGADAGMIFACRFAPLPLDRPLADGQDRWLGEVDPLWTAGWDLSEPGG
ncbi:NUDIX hydrolase [Actinomadura parmotrematis]|uniref:NUDIX domain-containing protein n=1 Tax=Actinomadura parmotrematis TaxID=2864039 RepID=A0ABS7FZN6_9ACTN|nr:NUDIX domain-containing protein [Actinomadura parmotrematis]MBW8485726.1 NUDIX domain-containing protein [Actinomadura parmotrematis]